MNETQHSLQTYISDMLAVEQHVREPFAAQLNDDGFTKFPSAQALIRRLAETSNAHIAALEQLLAQEGGHQAHPVKGAVSATAGFFASAIDKIRKTQVAKALRDDYTAISLCTISYTMLITTANAYGRPDVAQRAQQHMRDYAQIVMEIGLHMPEIVIADLQDTGMPADASVAGASRMQVEEVWRSSAAAERSQSSSTGEVSTLTSSTETSQSV